jgi:hypothetical protein
MINILGSEELDLLFQLEKAEFVYYGGPDLRDFQTATSIILATSNVKLQLSGGVIFETFQGYPNEYSKTEIQLANPETLSHNEIQGNTYEFHQGEAIQKVEVIEETVEEWVAGEKTWVYRTDVAISLKFETGSISITKLHHNHEVLHVEHDEQDALASVPEIESFFEDDLLKSHKISHRTLDLDQAKSRLS